VIFLREILHQNRCSFQNQSSKDMDDAPGEHMESAALPMFAASERLSAHDLAIVDEELCRALVGAANYG
jgi:hypothetical protein